MFSFWKCFLSHFCKAKLSLKPLISEVVIIISGLLLLSCNKQETLLYSDHSIPRKDEITSVYFTDRDHGIAVGGATWTRGLICKTKDGGQFWQVDSVFDKQILCMTNISSDLQIAMGIEFNLYLISNLETRINTLNHRGGFRFIRGISAFNSNHILAVHGLGMGMIHRISLHSDTSQIIHTINRDLNAIQCLDSLHWIVCGFGIVLRTSDGGMNWDSLEIFGDHFIDISWNVHNSLHLLGAAGTVYVSHDKGKHFTKIKSGGIIGNSQVYRCIAFKNAEEGIIAGEDGLVMFTRDSGKNWIEAEGLPRFDCKDIYHDGQRYWICGSDGRIISLAINN
jgi:photosystem II stability/assembly factor-like uncharacterized protein